MERAYGSADVFIPPVKIQYASDTETDGADETCNDHGFLLPLIDRLVIPSRTTSHGRSRTQVRPKSKRHTLQPLSAASSRDRIAF